MAKKKATKAKIIKPQDKCLVPPPMQLSAMSDYRFGESGYKAKDIKRYVEGQCQGEKVTFLEKVGKEALMGRVMDVWNVHLDDGEAWWVVTNPTNLYSQRLFPSMDYTLTFHIGLMTRMMERAPRAEVVEKSQFFKLGARIEDTQEALNYAEESEQFQAVGVQIREILIDLVRLFARPEVVPQGSIPPKSADVLAWSELIGNYFASGASSDQVRLAIKNALKSAWQYSNWLTHSKNAVAADGHIGMRLLECAVELVVDVVQRFDAGLPERCPKCKSYQVGVHVNHDPDVSHDIFKVCHRCGWAEPNEKPVS